MKSKKMIIGAFIIVVIGIGGFVWWNVPSQIIDIEPSEVTKISVFDGNTGESIKITDATDIEHIINNLNMVSLEKEKISVGYTGYSYRIIVYKDNDNVHEEFYINSNESIRKDPFFYRDSTGKIDYTYIQELFDKDQK